MLKKLGRQHSLINTNHVIVNKNEMSRDESETSRCCDLSVVDEESSGNGDESKLIEMQDDLKAKTLQLDILRETLSTMSATMRRQEFQLEGKDVQIETYIRLLEEKTAECNEWKSKYETLALKIEGRVNESEKFLQQSNVNVSTLPVPKACDPLSLSRPWKSTVNNNFTTISDDTSTASDSIQNSYAETEINTRRCPKRGFRSSRNNEDADAGETVIAEQICISQYSASDQEIRTSDGIVHHDESHIIDGARHEAQAAMNSECHNTKFNNLQENQFESEYDPSSSQDELQSVGFSFEVDIPFSDPESIVKQSETGSDLDEADVDHKNPSQVEILSLHHFIQIYDQYHIEDEDINCAADLTTMKDDADDAISVISNATMDSSAGLTYDQTSCSTAKKENLSVTRFVPSDMDELQHASIEAQRKKAADSLRRRVIRTAKREAMKAQFNCEEVEC